MVSEAQKSTDKLGKFTLSFFALIGFLASLTTIFSYFSANSSSAISVEARVSDFLVPKYVSSYLADNSSTRKLAKELMESACKGIDSNKLIAMNNTEFAEVKIDGVKFSDIELCRDSHALEFLARWSNSYSENAGVLVVYDIENVGSDVAKQLRLEAEGINAAQIKRGSKFEEIKKSAGGESFELPDLNPREITKIYIWSNSLVFNRNLLYEDRDDFPAVTFAGSSVSFKLFKPVTGFWSDTSELFSDTPILIILFIVVVAALLISGLVVLIISLMASLFKGKGISGAFNSSENTPPKE